MGNVWLCVFIKGLGESFDILSSVEKDGCSFDDVVRRRTTKEEQQQQQNNPRNKKKNKADKPITCQYRNTLLHHWDKSSENPKTKIKENDAFSKRRCGNTGSGTTERSRTAAITATPMLI